MKNLTYLFAITILLFTCSLGCKKSPYAPPGSQYTARMGGTRTWHGASELMGSSYYSNDTIVGASIAITVVNDTAVKMYGNELEFHSYIPNQSITFGSVNPNSAITLTYYFIADTMVYTSYQVVGVGEELLTSLSTP